MKLTELEPQFLKRTSDQSHAYVNSLEEADGILFDCPHQAHGKVLCWKKHIPQTTRPTGGRWDFTGTGYDDLTIHPSVYLNSSCGAHFFVIKGEVVWC